MMTRSRLQVLWLAVPLLLACGPEGVPRGPVLGASAPAYGAQTLDGDSIALADLAGRVVLLNVWATWCPPCREEIPALQQLHERYSDRGLDVVGVSIDGGGERDNVRSFLEGYGVDYPIWHDPADRITSTYRVQGVPTTFLIDRDGTLLWRHVGPVTADHVELNRLIDTAL